MNTKDTNMKTFLTGLNNSSYKVTEDYDFFRQNGVDRQTARDMTMIRNKVSR